MERADRINVKYIFLFFLAIFTFINVYIATATFIKLSNHFQPDNKEVSVEVIQPIQEDIETEFIETLPDQQIEPVVKGVETEPIEKINKDKEKPDKPKEGNVKTSVFVNDPSL